MPDYLVPDYFVSKSKNILDEVIEKISIDFEHRYYYNLALIFEHRRKRLISFSVNMLSHYHHGNCETVHAEREAWRNMRRNRSSRGSKCSNKETYFIVSLRVRDGKITNGGKFCNTCSCFLKKSQISYGLEFIDGQFHKIEF